MTSEGNRRSSWRRYGAAVLAVGLAAAGTAGVEALTAIRPFSLFVAAVGVGALYGGARPGLVAVLLGFLVSDVFFFRPYYRLTLNGQTLFLGAVYGVGLCAVLLARSRASEAAGRTRSVGVPGEGLADDRHRRNGRCPGAGGDE
jgi:K+-sensing histidine kinase KdpD